MNKKEAEFIKEIIGYEIKVTPTKSFAEDTLKKKQNMNFIYVKRQETNLWHPSLIPVALYVILMLVLSLIKILITIVPINNMYYLQTILNFMSGFLQEPIIMACLTSLFVLYLLNYFLRRVFYKKSLSEMKRT